jgi:hypothetical protein
MRNFAFGGLRLCSSVDLPFLDELPGGEGDCDVRIVLSASPLPSGELRYRSAGRYALELYASGADWQFRHRDMGIVVAERGRRLICHCSDPADIALLVEILVRRILPRVCYLHGRLPIHAAMLGNETGATMLLGASGAGKSTMTAALARYLGWRIFSDDMTILDDSGVVNALGGTAGVSLWKQAVAGLNIPSDHLVPMAGYDGKYAYRPRQESPLPLPLSAILLLSEPTDDPAIRFDRLTGPEVLVTLCSQLVPFNRGDVVENGDLMRRVGQVAAGVPVFALSYPRDFATLPAIANAVAAHLKGQSA